MEKINFGSHSVKALDSRQKQCAIRTELKDLGHRVFASHLLKTKYFAVPNNAALLPVARQEAIEANEKTLAEIGEHIPNIEDGKIKQILLPYQNDYIAVTPVPNLNIMANLNQYSLAIGSYHKQCIQPVGAATANHGDPVCANRGYLKLIRNWVPKYQATRVAEFESPVILITARCEGMNISSSYVAMGLPQLTAIGGFIHTIERNVGKSLPFGFGIQYFSSKLATTVRKGTATTKGTPSQVNPEKQMLFSDEITTNAEIAFILKANDPETLKAIQEFSKLMNRFSGGTLWDIKVDLVTSVSDYFWYQADSDTTPLMNIKLSEEVDYKSNLKDDLLEKYEQWESQNPTFSGFIKSLSLNYRLIQSGYALLDEPKKDDKSRSESKLHAWAEPVFSLIELGNNPTFFKLSQNDSLFIWQES